MHHAYTAKILEAPIFNGKRWTVAMVTTSESQCSWGQHAGRWYITGQTSGDVAPGHWSKVSVMVFSIWIQFWFLSIKKLILDLCLNSTLHKTSHCGKTARSKQPGEGTTDWKNDTVRQAGGQQDGAALGKDCSPEDTEKQSAKWSFSNYSHGCCCSAL